MPTLEDLERAFRRQILIDRLAVFDGIAAHAAQSLGINVRTFERMAIDCGLQRKTRCSRQWLAPAATTTSVS